MPRAGVFSLYHIAEEGGGGGGSSRGFSAECHGFDSRSDHLSPSGLGRCQ